ncbi:MAG TPA: ATP synthase F1 subunit delta [Gemmatimonadales bacterium]|nr:ATP synthase F1 subunit delta [Gemmatimonadales bacterium]
MRPVTVARTYAEALLEVADRSGQAARYGELLEAFADAVATAPGVDAVLMSPRVPKAAKLRLIENALADVPREFVRFVQAVVKRGRQALLRDIAAAYRELLDEKLGRVRAAVVVARAPDPDLQRRIAEGLSRAFGKEVIPVFHQDPAILGGMVVRVGDRIYDGSVRRRMATLRRQLLRR